jgi:L-threonate 2-dehydrogenase
VGFDVRPDMRNWLTERGGTFANSLPELAKQCSVVVSFVVNDVQTEEVLFGANGLVGSLATGAVVVTCSTMSPTYVARLAERLAAHSVSLIDAPVTGGAAGAAKGTLTIMAAGAKDAFARAKPVLDAFGAHVHFVSERPGAGSQLKVINQLLCGVHLAAAGEALALAKRQGLPLDITIEVLRSGAASSWMLCDRGPRMVREAYDEVTSAVDIFVKDLGLVLDAARDVKFSATLASAAHNAFLAVAGSGKGRWDDSAVMTNYNGKPYEGEIPLPQKDN